MLIIWKIFCILLLSLGAFGVGLGISYLDFSYFYWFTFSAVFSSLEASKREDAGSFPD